MSLCTKLQMIPSSANPTGNMKDDKNILAKPEIIHIRETFYSSQTDFYVSNR